MGKVINYKFIKFNQVLFDLDKLRKRHLLLRLTHLFFFIGLILSFKLWLPIRTFPLVPVLHFTNNYAIILGLSATAVLFFLIIFDFLRPTKKKLVFILISLLILVLLDQIRLQPWVYLYSLFYVVILIIDNDDSYDSDSAIYNLFRIILIGVYFWAGCHKLNEGFIDEIFYPMLDEVYPGITNAEILTKYGFLGYIIPLIEIITACCLLIMRFRFIGVLLSFCIHIFALIFLISINYNTIVYPWNIAMMLYTFLTFYKQSHTISLLIHYPVKIRIYIVAFVIVVWILPALNLLGKWDHYLSFSLYSGKPDFLIVNLHESAESDLPEYLTPYIYKNDTQLFISIDEWCLGELNVPVYPEKRVYRSIASRFCYLSKDHNVSFRLYKPPFKETNFKVLKCPEM